MASEKIDKSFLDAVRAHCQGRDIPFTRTPGCGLAIWHRRMAEAVKNLSVFTLLCHPINLTVKNDKWKEPLKEFLFPAIDLLGELNRGKKAWVRTCGQRAEFFRKGTC